MKTYKELRENFFEEVGKIDVGKLSLMGYGGSLREYSELLKSMADIPSMSREEEIKAKGLDMCCCLNNAEVPKIDKGGK